MFPKFESTLSSFSLSPLSTVLPPLIVLSHLYSSPHPHHCSSSDLHPTLSFLSLHSGADAIIRQHKAACLRITALLACKDLLWIGTSAGKNALFCLRNPKYINLIIQLKAILFHFIIESDVGSLETS